ncbi:MAG TPA: hypothetical protein VGR28_12470 [Candidatus Thermoplasmatota archaeon]|jgi:hypothetical protein|nr:hypothetical protein [Candidatus Thermoplasmatota archaeon]
MAPIDLLSAGLGLGVGVLATLFVRELAYRKIQNVEHSKLTHHWSLSETGHGAVRLCTERLDFADVPPGSQVLVGRGTQVPAEVAKRCEVRVSDRIQSNFALAQDKALVFASTVRPGALAIWTYEVQVLQSLDAEWERAWRASEPSVPRASVTSLPHMTGRTVEVVGSVSDVAEKGGVHYVRLMENGFTATVATSSPVAAQKGSVVRAIGTVEKALVGREPVIRAVKVEAVARA